MKIKKMLKKAASVLTALALATTMGISSVAFAAEGDTDTSTLMTPDEAKAAGIVAFPGVEGGGKYTTGGRGGDVYHVTNLNDSGEGSLRDAISEPNRTVVFDVSGTIHLESILKFEQPNITIAGQTAPGDGICIGDYNILLNADNIIIRYLRVRPGGVSDGENDAVSARYYKDFVIDHCSTSWSTDETFSIYGVANTTVQYCIMTESLAMGTHAKGRHGYGGIWGGSNTTYHHNLISTHTSRLPRYYSAKNAHPDFVDMDDNDMVNNVIYNWGFNNSYGGEGVTLNVINNYYKPGPITNNYVLGRIWNPSNNGKFYFSGNVLEGNDEVTADNLKGVQYDDDVTPIFVDEPSYEYLYEMDSIDTAEDAYEKVLAEAGATLPKRDSYDAKIINDVKNSTGRSINDESEVAGWPELNSEAAPLDTDRDGIPDEYEDANGLDKNNYEDGKAYAENGYTNLENYLNYIVETGSEPQNPEVTLNVETNTIFDYEETVTLTADAKAADGRSITKVEFFNGDELIGTDETAPYSIEYTFNTEGNLYLSARAVDSEGEATLSEVKSVSVNYTEGVGDWNTIDIGETTMPGGYAYRDGVYTIKSSGLIGAGNEFNVMDGDEGTDAFSFMYKEADSNSVISTEITSVSKLNNNCVSGIMMRDELTETSDFVMLNYEHEKGGAGVTFAYRINGEYNRTFLRLSELPRYVKLVKVGNTVTGFHSTNGVDWEYMQEVEINFSGTDYAGLAQDGNKETNQISNYSWGKFENLSLENYGTNTIPDVAIHTGNGTGDTFEADSQFMTNEDITVKVESSELESSDEMSVYVDGELSQTYATPQEYVTVNALGAGNHYITVVLSDGGGAKNSATQNIGVSSFAADDSGWDVADIHYPKDVQEPGSSIRHGAFDLSGNSLKLYGTGYGIEGVENEEYPLMYKELTGDFKTSFKIETAKADLADYDQMGFVVRNSLEADGASYAAYVQIYNGEMFRKTSEYGETYSLIGQQKYKQTPLWISFEKMGNVLMMKYSKDGTEWIEVGTEVADELNDTYYFGIFGASNEEFKISEFELGEFSFESYSSGGYTDMSDYDWAENAVNTLTLKGILSGDTDESGRRVFNPSDNVTRAEFAKMAVEAYKTLNTDVTVPEYGGEFTDVPSTSSEWYTSYVYEAAALGLMNGVSDTEFEPNRTITREEIAAIAVRMSADEASDTESNISFADANEISDWAKTEVALAAALGIMQGDENQCFKPLDFAERAEAAQVIYNLIME